MPTADHYIKRAKFFDRVATGVITASGVAVIACVILILLLIFRVALPLFLPAQAALVHDIPTLAALGDATVLGIALDDYLETGIVITSDGRGLSLDVRTGEILDTQAIDPEKELADVETLADGSFALRWTDNAISIHAAQFSAQYDAAGTRTITPRLTSVGMLPAPKRGKTRSSRVAHTSDGRLTRVDVPATGGVEIYRRSETEDILGNATTEESSAALPATEAPIRALILDSRGDTLFAGLENGVIERWDLRNADAPRRTDRVEAASAPITALAMIFGDISLVAGDASGGISSWMMVRPDPAGADKVLAQIHRLPAHDAPVAALYPSRRNKTFLSYDVDGVYRVHHMTSERCLIQLEASGLRSVAGLSARGNGMLAATHSGGLQLWSLDIPHPEVSWRTLLGKIWYERYDAPDYVWQSSAASDDFEPKLSLIPLFFGSLKATFYAMFLAVPLALFGAVYTSQFAQRRVRNAVKSSVEVMAAVPSVVIGFLAALWFAPLVERHVLVFLFAFIVFPAIFIVFMLSYTRFRNWGITRRIERGYEFAAVLPVILVAVFVSYGVAHGVEQVFCGGDFRQWLFEVAGERYDQRNSIIIAFALGFAVIPIIFTIAEDALSSVPFNLKAASLALSATRWQTVWRVILPSASPGIFAGVMIGFGRAVGETMIVLMATGNTPIIDWSPFNGMRTLSANIAVEIPEAPVDGTLYRVLFLYAVVLFCLTFFANTFAEVVRQRLRKKYGQF